MSHHTFILHQSTFHLHFRPLSAAGTSIVASCAKAWLSPKRKTRGLKGGVPFSKSAGVIGRKTSAITILSLPHMFCLPLFSFNACLNIVRDVTMLKSYLIVVIIVWSIHRRARFLWIKRMDSHQPQDFQPRDSTRTIPDIHRQRERGMECARCQQTTYDSACRMRSPTTYDPATPRCRPRARHQRTTYYPAR